VNTLKHPRHYRQLLIFLVSLYGLLLAGLLSLPYWPSLTWVFASLISFAPLWLYFLPLLVLAPLCLLTRQTMLLVVLLGVLLLLLKFSGWVFNLGAAAQGSDDSLVVISANVGNVANVNVLNKLIVENNADLVALQEVPDGWLAPLLMLSPLNSVCVGELCLLSHLPLKLVESKSRALLRNWGHFAMQVEVGLPSAAFDFYVLHLETPREGFEALLANPLTGWSALSEVIDGLATESWIASNWIAQGRNPIAAGDFNLPRNNPIYEKYWRWLGDSFYESGTGFGYSKHTRLHGVQIDHILHSQAWTAQKTWVTPSLGGDHLPVITVLTPSDSIT
jgi:endonuclease/exonuclease/phosphatase (EEP) superfamily protein YafD